MKWDQKTMDDWQAKQTAIQEEIVSIFPVNPAKSERKMWEWVYSLRKPMEAMIFTQHHIKLSIDKEEVVDDLMLVVGDRFIRQLRKGTFSIRTAVLGYLKLCARGVLMKHTGYMLDTARYHEYESHIERNEKTY
jgi:hypothetical protein